VSEEPGSKRFEQPSYEVNMQWLTIKEWIEEIVSELKLAFACLQWWKQLGFEAIFNMQRKKDYIFKNSSIPHLYRKHRCNVVSLQKQNRLYILCPSK